MYESFPLVKLGDLFEIVKGSVCPFLFPTEEFVHHSLPAFDASNGPIIQFGLEIESNKTLLSEPVVLLSKLNPRISRVSVADPSRSNRRHCCSTEFIAYKEKHNALSLNFYRYLFESSSFRQRLESSAVGTTNSHVRVNPVGTLNWGIPYPSAPEQAKIAEILSTVDRAIEQTEALIAKQQRIKTGLMQELLTRGIDEHGNIRSEKTHQFKDSPLGRIPVEWETVAVSTVLVQPPKNGYSPVESNDWNGRYMLGLGCLTNEGFKPIQLKNAPETDPKIETALLHEGDFLISRSNTRSLVGQVGIYKDVGEPCIYPDLMIRLKFSNEVTAFYMEQVFMSPHIRRQIENNATGTSGSMVKISASVIKEILFSKPSLEEQNVIINILNCMNEEIRKSKTAVLKLRSLKTALMQDLLTGKKRVTSLLDKEVMTHETGEHTPGS